ncbi:interleukin-17 receptor C [Seriola aureovittata]|uniref:interleukin-17 receptor C n=1 Tax=Seriola aureovittata TaxID=2871759 RepID=UPI0024BE961C|nr:interleukin-17 receptor C [Seriola aureovittata]XP_056249751.1 interleukin-17 receptor C [Seriola aureovittata]XP_056249761.1 interleukin-17 receptor C [Seriola aureovittata]XP_056249772.1 interleukin-17 receptor C [Seriola aureovittata]
MYLPGWFIWWVSLTIPMSACGLEVSGHDSDEVICSQGLSECTMKDEIPFLLENDAVDVLNLTAYFKLCSKSSESCTLCLVIDMELHIHPDNDTEDEDHSGLDGEDYSEVMRDPKASVTVCYNTPSTIPTCKKVEFTVNHAALTQQNQAKVSMVITEPPGVSFSTKVFVYPHELLHLKQEVIAPSLHEVCSQKLKKCVNQCRVPKINITIHEDMKYVELLFDGNNNSVPSVCVQYEQNGTCQSWNKKKIPLYSVTHCMCLQAWYNQNYVRAQSCPFRNTDRSHRNVWENVSVSVSHGHSNHYGSMLLWNISAPCRLEGEVWPCHKENSCKEMKGLRKQLANGSWRQNSKGLWEKTGAFEDINLQLSPCVMVKVKGMGRELGPFCFTNTDRWRWSLLVVGVVLLVFLAVLLFYLHHDFVKKWVWSWHHGGFVKISRKGHVVLLSPPDLDDGLSDSVCRLGSLLCNKGFNVSVDQWSRKEQCTLGPLLWLHSKLLELDSRGNRVVVVLNRKAIERTEEWMHQYEEVIKTKGEDKGLPQMCSPYSDLFTASLCIIHADKQLGRAGERFLLVKFDSHPSSDRNLPELLQGLPLFQLPFQTQALLTELTVGHTGTSGGKTWTRWKWGGSYGWSSKTKEGQNQQRASLYNLGVEKNLETKPLKHP